MVNAQEESLLCFGREQDLKGERGKLTYWCMPIALSLFFPQFSLLCFSFLSLVFFYSVFFLLREYPLFFHFLFRARQGSFYSACHDRILPLCPLTTFVWSGCTCRPPKGSFVCHSLLPDKSRFVSFVSPP